MVALTVEDGLRRFMRIRVQGSTDLFTAAAPVAR
jgi:hypothetical protein